MDFKFKWNIYETILNNVLDIYILKGHDDFDKYRELRDEIMAKLNTLFAKCEELELERDDLQHELDIMREDMSALTDPSNPDSPMWKEMI